MNTTQLKRVRRLFNSDLVPREHNRSYQRQWVRQIRMLGDRWLLLHINKGAQ
jgi:hypothetical protein